MQRKGTHSLCKKSTASSQKKSGKLRKWKTVVDYTLTDSQERYLEASIKDESKHSENFLQKIVDPAVKMDLRRLEWFAESLKHTIEGHGSKFSVMGCGAVFSDCIRCAHCSLL